MALPPYRWLVHLVAWLGLDGRGLVIAIPYAWMLFFFAAPFLIILVISFGAVELRQPPLGNFIEWIDDGYNRFLNIKLNLINYITLFTDDLYVRAYLNSVKIAAISTFFCLLIGFPIAYGMARAAPSIRPTLVMLVILPFWTSFLIRVYAWIGILQNDGFLNNLLIGLGIIDQPLVMMNTDFAVYVGIVYSYLPFMILPLYANLERMDLTLLEAAADLGCRPIKAFWVVTVPLASSGIIAGCFLVFIPAVGEYVIPDLMGGSGTLMIGKQLWLEFNNNRDWPLASAVAVILLMLLVVPIVLFQRQQAKAQGT
ncbi:ABC transporter permease subunit [Zavarzinia sp. CC-PAN008]|uniref:ABC transporter permease subunit n=1 Tax=Zavarzinia sp. CC-PAN008 TaxID=3243332 RepID=UPI003F7455BD